MRKHYSLILSIILVIIAASVYYLSVRSTASPYTGRSSDSFLCTSSCKQYPLSAEQISVTISNTGDYSGEIDKPILEQKRSNTWYSVKPEELSGHTLITSELLYVLPGSPRTFALSLEPYRSHLSPGEYRFVFGLHASAQFFSYEFTLTAS